MNPHDGRLKARWTSGEIERSRYIGSETSGDAVRVSYWIQDAKDWEKTVLGTGPYGRLTAHLHSTLLGLTLQEYHRDALGEPPVRVPDPDVTSVCTASEAARRLADSLLGQNEKKRNSQG